MSIYVQTTAQSELHVGTPMVLQARAPTGALAAVFEDDGETGYFYAVDPADPDHPIQDALHIYDVKGVADPDNPSEVRIGWSSDSTAVLLASGFPPPVSRGWSKEGHQWRDSMLDAFAQ